MSVRKARWGAAWRCWIRIGALLACACVLGCAPAPPKTVVIIGGAASEGPGKHDYPQGVRKLQALIEAAPEARAALRVIAYPDGWPRDPRALDGADTVVWYFDGLDRHPLRDPQRRRQFESLMRRGVGLVALHQSSTVPVGEDLGLPRWLGGAREGMFDRSTEWAELRPVAQADALVRGLSAFSYRDEFYPTFRFATAGGRRTPVLKTVLHPQFRAGRRLIDDRAEDATVAWAFERDGGGRGFVYSGAHYLSALDQPQVAGLLLNAIAWSAGVEAPRAGLGTDLRAVIAPRATYAPASPARATFHIDAARSGWRRDETVLTPQNVNEAGFGEVWQSLPLDGADGQPARLYASPLYLDRLTLTQGPLRGESFPTVFAASNTGYVYAIAAAQRGDIAAGRVLWRTRLGEPCRLQPAPLDGVPTGILSTPVVDAVRGRLYVTHCDPVSRWQAYALDIGSGALLPGWPVRLDEERFNAVNANAGPRRVPPKRRFDFRVQRGALNLSPDGGQLYVAFGESETGWLAAVDTQRARVGSAFAAVAMPHRGSGGIWGAGGPAVDADGHVYVVTGSGFDGYQDAAHDWAQSLLKLAPPDADGHGFVLRGTYTPFNYCQTAKADIDLGSGGAVLLPQASAGGSRLLAVGGKQGNAYLLDRDRLPGGLERRPACSEDAAGDGSLLPPQAQPQFGGRGPLNVFGPYSEHDAALDLARSRSVPATFRDRQGVEYLYVTGNSKRAPGSAQSVPPSLVRLRVVRDQGDAPFLRIDRRETTLALGNPGSPVVTSQGAERAVVWVLDENAPRSALLSGDDAPRPVLYAFDAASLKPLWRSAAGELYTSGKYNEPAFGGGQVYVGTDRIQAFGIGGRRRAEPTPSKSAAPIRTAPADPALAGMDSAALYRLRCAACHDHAQGNIPPRSRIAALQRDRIVHALSEGLMRPQATGLSAEQVGRLGDYLRQGER